jgi:hypothetical protein
MPPIHELATASLFLSIGVAAVAALLFLLVWNDRGHRHPELPPDDAEHFARQDVRRVVGTVVMLLLSAAIYFGSRIPPRAADRANPLFVQIWLGTFLLIFFLLVLGLLDWQATRLYARRHRQAIVRERIELLKEELKHQAFRTNGREHPEGHAGEPLS